MHCHFRLAAVQGPRSCRWGLGHSPASQSESPEAGQEAVWAGCDSRVCSGLAARRPWPRYRQAVPRVGTGRRKGNELFTAPPLCSHL